MQSLTWTASHATRRRCRRRRRCRYNLFINFAPRYLFWCNKRDLCARYAIELRVLGCVCVCVCVDLCVAVQPAPNQSRFVACGGGGGGDVCAGKCAQYLWEYVSILNI